MKKQGQVAKEAKEDSGKMRRCGSRVKRVGCDGDGDGDGKGSDLGGERGQQQDKRAGPRGMRVSCDKDARAVVREAKADGGNTRWDRERRGWAVTGMGMARAVTWEVSVGSSKMRGQGQGG
jgi:hypothetical protein